jgi:hypothetical protein
MRWMLSTGMRARPALPVGAPSLGVVRCRRSAPQDRPRRLITPPLISLFYLSLIMAMGRAAWRAEWWHGVEAAMTLQNTDTPFSDLREHRLAVLPPIRALLLAGDTSLPVLPAREKPALFNEGGRIKVVKHVKSRYGVDGMDAWFLVGFLETLGAENRLS